MLALTEARKTSLRREMEALLGPGSVLSDPDELLVYESDGLTLFRALADFVVFPLTAEHVAALVRLAQREGLPFVARGAGPGLSGGWLPGGGGPVLPLLWVQPGSEGTFGIATKIVLRILRQPQAVRTVLAVFNEIDQASEAVSAIIARGLIPAAMEMIDQLTIQAVEAAFGCGSPRDAAAVLLIEMDGLAAGMDEQAARVIAACRETGAREVRLGREQGERPPPWEGGKSALGAHGGASP